ncbi:MAG: hypothetical protein U1F53_12520 [Burkholderiaceae bacterium]
MKPTLAYPLVLAAVAAAAAFSVQAAAEPRCGCADRPATPSIQSADPAAEPPVADDPAQPLDPRDPQFARKAAQRYRALAGGTAGATR